MPACWAQPACIAGSWNAGSLVLGLAAGKGTHSSCVCIVWAAVKVAGRHMLALWMASKFLG